MKTSIPVSEKLRSKLMVDKNTLSLKTAEQVIWRLYKIVNKVERADKLMAVDR